MDIIEIDTRIAGVSKEEGGKILRYVGKGWPTPYSWEWRAEKKINCQIEQRKSIKSLYEYRYKMYSLLNTVYGKNRLHIGYNGKVYCLNVILDVHNMMKLMLKHVHICDKLEV